jgi:hypothetical protein
MAQPLFVPRFEFGGSKTGGFMVSNWEVLRGWLLLTLRTHCFAYDANDGLYRSSILCAFFHL